MNFTTTLKAAGLAITLLASPSLAGSELDSDFVGITFTTIDNGSNLITQLYQDNACAENTPFPSGAIVQVGYTNQWLEFATLQSDTSLYAPTHETTGPIVQVGYNNVCMENIVFQSDTGLYSSTHETTRAIVTTDWHVSYHKAAAYPY